ncbi:hypothetical protein CO726_02630 [Bacillus fungorum]|uniref:Uncharacterized protein n=1 Tax=Bacillus fungorum TaxID=2039284 RepID=A0A2G6QK65_9BACI|nr:hypothetical protein [Bacillus fungorum]PIE97218.1 hypothetical protein CO726_02630 [Bacillus fungorum]
MMKVFKMNDCDWVCAETEEQAKEFYKNECGFEDDEVNEYFEGEVSLNTMMHVDADDLPEEELTKCQQMTKYGDTLLILKPFKWVIEHENITSPCVIASTEY